MEGAPPERLNGAGATLALRVDEREVERARRFVAEMWASWGFPPNDDLVLVTSEVVTNAIVHARTESVCLSVHRTGGCVHVDTTDDDPTPPVVIPFGGRTGAGGLGVALMNALATDWGVADVRGNGKRVWFEMELPGRSAVDR